MNVVWILMENKIIMGIKFESKLKVIIIIYLIEIYPFYLLNTFLND